jgi:RNA polymerase sigma-B factor
LVGEDLTASLGRSPTIAEISEAAGAEAEAVVEALVAWKTRAPLPLLHPPDDHADEGVVHVDALAVTEDGYDLIERRWAVAQALRVLDARERMIVALSFFAELSQAQIALQLGISQMHVSRLLRRALAKAAAAGGAPPPAVALRSSR